MINPRLKAALQYASQGLYVFPAPPGEKKSYKSSRYSNGQPWGRTKDESEIRRDFMRWPDANVGIVTGVDSGTWVSETDTPKGHDVDGIASLKKLIKKHGALPETRQAISPTGSVHYYWVYPKEGIIKNSASIIGPGIDVRGDGGMVIAPPSVRPGKGEYKWLNKSPIVDAPEWLLDLVIEKDGGAKGSSNPSLKAHIGLVAAAVACIANKANTGWDQWNCIGMAIWAACSGHDEGFRIFDEWSQKWPLGYNASNTADRWRSYASSPPVSIGAGTIFYLANTECPGWRADYEATLPNALPQVRLEPGRLAEVCDEAEAVLLRAAVETPIYRRAGALVRPIIETVDATHGRLTAIAQFQQIDLAYMRVVLSRRADFRKYSAKAKGWVACDPPADIAASILSRVGEWRFPIVVGVMSTPTMRFDGTILDTPGYDPETRLLLIEPPATPDIAAAPSREDALAGLALLKDLLCEFVFADDGGVAEAVALSAIISPVVRGAFPTVPMHVARAPVAASGKSYLFDIVAAIAIGQPMPVMAAGRTEEETEKRLGAALLSGQPLVSIDNVNGELRGDALCQIIERPIVEIRILGRSERVRIEARATSMFCTGNNVALVGDLTRRAITSTLDPGVERPELRVFEHDPVAKVLDNRGAYIGACLTICRAYIAAGRPERAARLASFEGWSDTVRSALMWLGEADPVMSMEISRAEDPELTSLNNMLVAWARVIGVGYSHKCSLAEVIELAEQRAGDKYKWPELHAAVMAVAWQKGAANTTAFGRWMRYRKDRVVGGLRLCSAIDAHKKTALWWVQGAQGGDIEGAAGPDGAGGNEKSRTDRDDPPF